MPLFLSTVAKPWRPEAQQSTACEQQEDSMKVWGWIQKSHWWAILCLSSCTWVLKIIPRYGYFRMGKLSIAKIWQPLFKIPRISRTALNSFKRGRICIPGYVHWSSVSSLVNKTFFSNHGVLGCIKDWSDITEGFILCCCERYQPILQMSWTLMTSRLWRG